ncbi:MAG: alginate export family protein [Flammeovirgaceae bacterium]
MKLNTFLLTLLLLSSTINQLAYAQFTIDGQILQRAEYRNGFGKLLERGQEPAAFIGQRTRIQSNYSIDKFKFYASIQDIRIWGNTPQTKTSDDYLSVHEAWVETNLNENWSFKTGRQELNYDNFRFLGNLDWALQARAHDFALIKYEKEKVKIHFGGGFNQQEQRQTSTKYTLANQYKTAQLFRYENQGEKWQISFLLWNDGKEQGGKHYYKQTIGLPTLKYQINPKTSLSMYYYHQLGKNTQGKKISAYNASISIKHQINYNEDATNKLQLVAGLELISGTATDKTNKNHSYSPLYGTNHAHNGYMDYFYVGGAHENTVGLNDFFARARYDFNAKLFIQTDLHYFTTNAKTLDAAANKMNKYLGTEVDFSLVYLLHNAVSIQAGYSQMWASDTMKRIKEAQNPIHSQNWAYVMLIARPTMKNKFIGILL